jgi:hypothetical protein
MSDLAIRANFNSYTNETHGSDGFGTTAAQAALDGNRMSNGSLNMDALALNVAPNLGNENFMANINANLSPMQQGELARLTEFRLPGEERPLPGEGFPKIPDPFERRLPTWDSGGSPNAPDLDDDTETKIERLPATSYSDLHGVANIDAAPGQLVFSFELQGTFEQLMQDSYSPTGNQEQGGTLFVNIQTGDIGLANIGGFGSTSNSFTPNKNLETTPLGADIGAFHTHPYQVNVDPVHGVDGSSFASFSATDIYRVVIGEDNVSVASSGHNQFAMVRTSESGTNVSFGDFQTTFDNLVQSGRGEGLSFSAAVRDAVITLTQSFGVAYYEGSGGVLVKVTRSDPPPSPPSDGQ